jgi:hypothetical protein
LLHFKKISSFGLHSESGNGMFGLGAIVIGLDWTETPLGLTLGAKTFEL